MRGQILLDFDGTVAIEDTTDRLLERFADPAWRAIEADWQAQRIGSRECLACQVELVRASEAEIGQFIDNVRIDPGFDELLAACAEADFQVKIVSDGLDRIVRGVLARTGFNLPIAANRLVYIGENRWRLDFPHAKAECMSASGNCKCAHADPALQGPRIVIGDGRSDFCAAGSADYVFAKNGLRTYCEQTGIAHAAIADLGEAATLFRAWCRHISKSPRRDCSVTEELRHG